MIDNIFIDASRIYNIQPHINGLSDHDAQLITIKNFLAPSKQIDPHQIRIINNNTIAKFQLQLSWENWDDVFQQNDVNIKFNNLLNTYLRNYHSSLIKKERKLQHNKKQWLTNGIKISCNRKKELYLRSKLTNNQKTKEYYKRYCKILTKVIMAAKCLHFNEIIHKSKNKIKST